MFPLIPIFPLWEHLDKWLIGYKKLKSKNFVKNDVFYSLHSENKQIKEFSQKKWMIGINGLIYISIIIPRHILYLVCPSYLCDLFFYFQYN